MNASRLLLRIAWLPLLASCATDRTAADDLAVAASDLAVPADQAPPAPPDAMQAPDLVAPRDLAAAPPDLARADLADYVCYGPKSSFATFARNCAVDGDCYVGIHQIDCCGSHAAYGVRAAQAAAFEAAEAAFRVICPALCDCVPRATVCDDGRSAPEPMITVACEAGTCVTHGL